MRTSKTYDDYLLMKDAGLVASSGAAQVGGVDHIEDLGSGLVEADLVIDVSAIEIASNDEIYNLCVQVSSSATFASGIQTVAKLELGAAEALLGDQDSTVGRYILPFRNEFGGTIYRYARVYTAVAGTVATGINYMAWMAPK
jgi:hypothetical protein